MNTEVSDLLLKINKLEKQIKELSLLSSCFDERQYFLINKDFLNFSCLDRQKFELANIEVVKGNNLLFEVVFEVYSTSVQDVEVSLIINNLTISKTIKTMSAGINNITISQDYVSYINFDANVSVEINPLGQSEIIVQDSILKIWGMKTCASQTKYDAICFSDKYLVSMLTDNKIYYKIITKSNTAMSELDLSFYARALDYSFAYYDLNDSLYLFRIDLDGNLFVDDIEKASSTLVDCGVTSVTSITANEKMIAAYVKDSKCYFVEFENENSFAINSLKGDYIIKNCSFYFNEFSKKLYLVLCLCGGENIMLECDEGFCSSGENINASYNIFVETYEVTNEV